MWLIKYIGLPSVVILLLVMMVNGFIQWIHSIKDLFNAIVDFVKALI